MVLLHYLFCRWCANIYSEEVHMATSLFPHPFHDGVTLHTSYSIIGVNIEKGGTAVANSFKDFVGLQRLRTTGSLPQPESDDYG